MTFLNPRGERNQRARAKWDSRSGERVLAALLGGSLVIFSCLAVSDILDNAGENIWVVRVGYALWLPFLELGRVMNQPVDIGLWAFVAFAVMMLTLTLFRARDLGMWRSLLDTLTLIAPSVLLVFEVGIWFLVPNMFFVHAVNFVGHMDLSGVVTNAFVMEVAVAVFSVRLLIMMVGNLRGKAGSRLRL